MSANFENLVYRALACVDFDLSPSVCAVLDTDAVFTVLLMQRDQEPGEFLAKVCTAEELPSAIAAARHFLPGIVHAKNLCADAANREIAEQAFDEAIFGGEE